MILASGQGGDGVVALTIGMPTYNDFDGVYFTLQALRSYQDLRDTELLVVDNYGCPEHEAAGGRLGARGEVCARDGGEGYSSGEGSGIT